MQTVLLRKSSLQCWSDASEYWSIIRTAEINASRQSRSLPTRVFVALLPDSNTASFIVEVSTR